jgi:predicted transcriptional regulator
MDQFLKDLNMVVLYLSGWEEESERHPGEIIFRAWRGYLFEILDELEKDGLIYQHHQVNSVILTSKGIERAKMIREKIKS